MKDLSDWDSFYVILGSAAAALIGLQFVVMTLIAERPPRGGAQAGNAFATPTIIHFGVALLLSMLARVPWPGIGPLALLWGAIGVGGIGYTGIILRRIAKQSTYSPDFEDWLFHVGLPLAGYVAVAAAALCAQTLLVAALFGAGAAALLLLFVGIHNAWDAVVFLSFQNLQDGPQETQDKSNGNP